MTAQKLSSPLLAVVMTTLNEEQNIVPVCLELLQALKNISSFEIIIIDDGSTDSTLEQLFYVRKTFLPQLRILTHAHCLGKSAGLKSAISAARAPWIATMDGDGQDNPYTIQAMLDIALSYNDDNAIPLVVGVRRKRQDYLSRRLATHFANTLRQCLLRDGCPDTGAPLKLFPRHIFMSLPQFEGMHRFLPALMKHYGAQLVCIETQHRKRLSGRSKYTNINRALVGIRDILGVLWLRNRTRPLDRPTEL